jgi:hypothetical protein
MSTASVSVKPVPEIIRVFKIDQPAEAQDEWNVFARPARLVGWGKDCRAYDLARGIDWVRSTPLCARKIS